MSDADLLARPRLRLSRRARNAMGTVRKTLLRDRSADPFVEAASESGRCAFTCIEIG